MQVDVVDYTAPDAPERLTASLRETGFGVLRQHPISATLVTQIYGEWLDFFSTPSKHRYAFDPERQDGYFSTEVSETAKGHATKDLKEYYHVYPWGRYPTEVSDAVQRYYVQASVVAQTLLGWVQAHTPAAVLKGLSCSLPSMLEDSQQTLLRVLRYPPLSGQEPEGALRAAAHEDINLLTVLPAANEPGLQVRDRQGRWWDVPCDHGSLIINTGDMLQEATAGYFPSTTHRVLNPQGPARLRSRMSLPLFLHPRADVVLSERHTAGSYLQERLRELGLKS